MLYLWTSESLQRDRERNGRHGTAPAQRTARAIAAAGALVADPEQARWVRAQWGAGYLEHDDLFYRMLLVAGLDSYERLGGDPRHHDLLTRRVASLAAELDASPHGVLPD